VVRWYFEANNRACRGDCFSNTFEIKRGYVGTNSILREEALLIIPAVFTNHGKLEYSQGLLMITIGLWIQDKLLGSASFVLGSIGMFLGVPAIHFES
jgi:hypothetical protein